MSLTCSGVSISFDPRVRIARFDLEMLSIAPPRFFSGCKIFFEAKEFSAGLLFGGFSFAIFLFVEETGVIVFEILARFLLPFSDATSLQSKVVDFDFDSILLPL